MLNVGPNCDYAKPVCMQKLEGGCLPLQLIKEAPYAEVALTVVGVVEERDCARRQLRPPGLKIVAERIVAVQPIDVQEVDTRVGEPGECLVEGHAQQR